MAIVNAITSVFSAIMTWLLGALGDGMPLFYEASESGGGELTFLGVLAVMALGIGVVFLIINVVKGFLKFR